MPARALERAQKSLQLQHHYGSTKSSATSTTTSKATIATSSASSTAPSGTPPNDYIWFVAISEMPANNRSIQGPFTTPQPLMFTVIRNELRRKSPGAEGLEKFHAMVSGGAFEDVKTAPERFEAPLPGVDGGTIAFQVVRHVNKALSESKIDNAFTVIRAEFSMRVDASLGKLVIAGAALTAEEAFLSKGEAEFYLNKHTYEVREPDMMVGTTNIDGDLVSMCRNDKKIVILVVLESVMGCVIRAPNLTLEGPIFQKLYFGT